MKSHVRTVFAALVVLAAAAGPSQAATTVNFSDLIGLSDGLAGTGMLYSSTGLTFTSTVPGDLKHWGSANPFNADPGGATLLKLDDVVPMGVTRTGGGLFNLVSLQLAESENAAPGPSVDFTYTNGVGTFSSVLVVTVPSGLQTFVINQVGITSFTLGGADLQLDNVVYELAPVPEPGTYATLLVGLLALCRLAGRKAPGSR